MESVSQLRLSLTPAGRPDKLFNPHWASAMGNDGATTTTR